MDMVFKAAVSMKVVASPIRMVMVKMVVIAERYIIKKERMEIALQDRDDQDGFPTVPNVSQKSITTDWRGRRARAPRPMCAIKMTVQRIARWATATRTCRPQY